MTRRTLCLVAYDIQQARRRARALRAVKAFGLDGQKSVHECALSDTERRELAGRLQDVVDPATDRLMILPLDPRGRIRGLGAPDRLARPASVLVIR